MTHLPSLTWIGPLLIAAWYSAIPIIFAAVGGVVSERSGVPNIALEGFLLFGAFTSVWAGQHFAALGLAVALGAGILIGLLYAWLTQDLRIDPIISGIGLNLLAAGVTQYLGMTLYPAGIEVSGLSRWPFLLLSVIVPCIAWYGLGNTRLGLRIRSAGEDPVAARLAGVSARGVRYAALALSGALGSLGGVFLSLVDAHTFSSNMSAGKGYIALALVVFGGWNPLRVVLGALMFGLLYALQTQVQISGWHFNLFGVTLSDSELLDAIPYLMTIVVLALVATRVRPPAALAQPDPGING